MESSKYLKTKKAHGWDNTTNEMIKCSDRNMTEHLHTLYNNHGIWLLSYLVEPEINLFSELQI